MTSSDGVGTWRVGIKRIKIAVLVLLLAVIFSAAAVAAFRTCTDFRKCRTYRHVRCDVDLAETSRHDAGQLDGSGSGRKPDRACLNPNSIPTGWTLLPTTNCVTANTFPNAEVALCTLLPLRGASEPASYAGVGARRESRSAERSACGTWGRVRRHRTPQYLAGQMGRHRAYR